MPVRALKNVKFTDVFPILSRIAKLAFTICQSKADKESVFSIIGKNKTCFRPNLSLDKTLPSLLTIKLATNEPCYRCFPFIKLVALPTGKQR